MENFEILNAISFEVKKWQNLGKLFEEKIAINDGLITPSLFDAPHFLLNY